MTCFRFAVLTLIAAGLVFAQTTERKEGPLVRAAGATENAVQKTADATVAGTKAAGSGTIKAVKVTKDATVDGAEATVDGSKKIGTGTVKATKATGKAIAKGWEKTVDATGTALKKTGDGIGKVGEKVKD